MPDRPLRACRAPGCPATHHNAGGYCDAHAPLSRIQRTQTPDQRRYYSSARWQALRAVILRAEPLCRECAKHGRTAAATTVDHVDGDWRNEARANLQPLCRACHDQKTGRQHASKVGQGGGKSYGVPERIPGLPFMRALSAVPQGGPDA